MRLLSAVLFVAAAATAQSPLTTTFLNNNGGAVGGAVYFELECTDPAGVFITNIDLNFAGAGGDAGSIEIYVKDSSASPHTSADWVGPLSTGNISSSMPAGTPTNVGLAPSFQLGSGCKVGVAIVANGLAHAYTTATTLPSTYATAELELTVGGGSNVPFSGSLFTPRLVNISIPYTSGGTCPSIATVEAQGDGCGGGSVFASFYEESAPGTQDLSGMIVTGTNNGSGYDISVAPGAGVTVPGGATEFVGIGDDVVIDSATVGGTLGMFVGSNGWMSVGGGNSNQWSPTSALMLGNPSEGVYAWTDLQPNAAGSGGVWYSESGTVATVTYDGVYGWGTTDPNQIQITYDTSNGDWTIEFGTVGPTNPEPWLVGYSPAGPNADPGSTDITAAAPFSIAGMDDIQPNLALTSVGRPIQENFAVDYEVTTENIPSSAVGHIGILGLSRPNVALDGIGMPGCFLHASLDVLDFVVLPAPPSGTLTWTAVTLPPSGPFRRIYNFNVQSVVFGTSFNSYLGLGAITSNGLKCKTGKL